MTIITNKPDVAGDGAVPNDAHTKKAPAAAKIRPGALAKSGGPTRRPPSAAHLSDEQVAELGRELDAIRDNILATRGAVDAAYIRRMIKSQRGL
jgi:linoleoyl-CoA desaturase